MKIKYKILLVFFLVFFPAKYSYSVLPEIKIEEKKFAFIPQMQLSLPNAVVDIFMRSKVVNTEMNFSSKYDFLDNYIDAILGFRHHIYKFFIGIEFADKIDFEQIFSDQTYLLRSRYINTYIGYNVIKNTELKTSVRVENTSSASIDTFLVHDRGKNVTGNIGILYNTLTETPTLPEGEKITLDFTRSYNQLGSEYDYTQTEFEFTDFSYPFGNNYLKSKIKVGYPVVTIKKPLTSIYFAGGYDILRGYKYKEFYGNTIAYIELSHHIPLVLKKRFSLTSTSLEIVTGDISVEMCKIGEKEIFDNSNNIKTSFGIGSSCSLHLFKNINLRFNLSVNQAIDLRTPVFYFTLNTFSYINQPE